MVTFPPCKINLGLQIIKKRPDGYHDLVTCFYPVPWTDILEIIKADRFAFTSTGNFIPGPTDTNLCIRAYELLNKDFDLGSVKIHLHKIIPSGAGLGGGSSDAAYTLRMLNAIFHLQLSREKLIEYAATLGSDCAFFTQDDPMYGEGRGEILTRIEADLHGRFLVLVNPAIHVSTAEAFTGIRPQQPKYSLQELLQGPISDWKLFLKNDFEESVFREYPAIQDVKEKMYALGATYASMSGSGATVFGIFDSEIEAQNKFPDAAVWAGFV